MEKSTFIANETITFVIPQGVWDLKTLRGWFYTSMNGSTTLQSLPRDTETLIETLEVYVADQRVQFTQYYNQLVRSLLDYDRKSDDVARRSYMCNSLWIGSGLNNAVYTYNGTTQNCWSNWYGFLGSGEIINTKVLGPVKVIITLAPNQCLLSSVTNATYTLSDLHFTINAVDEDMYVPKSIEFANYQSYMEFNQSYGLINQMRVQSRHVDYVLTTFLPTDYRTKAISTSTVDNGTSWYFTHGCGSTLNMPSFIWNIRVNGIPMLTYYPNRDTALEFASLLFPGSANIGVTNMYRNRTANTVTYSNFMRNFYLIGIKLDIEAKDGVDIAFETRMGQQTASSLATGNFGLMFAKCDSALHYDPSTNRFIFEK